MPPLLAFMAVTLPLVATPGASTAVVLRNSIAGGRRAGLFTALGCNVASVCYGLLTALGFAAVLQRWPSVWLALRIAGVIYLAALGLRSLWRAARPAPPREDRRTADRGAWHAMASGFMTNLLNPSLAAFYLIVIPQFIPRGSPFARSALILTAIHVTLALSWHAGWAAAGAALARALSSGWPRRTLDVATGIALIALALTIAV